MSTTTLPSLDSLAGALGSIAGLETSLDIQQFNCDKNNLEKYFELSASSAQRYEIYPGNSSKRRNGERSSKLYRQGLQTRNTSKNY